ncbi:hypothetical protein KTO58_27995 [Chitinophaga pendula]|uniref:hypothetical protein n=1 Tax=Chitinophaga TaxID=79328 RepID=UPI000BAE97FE|nr:MULTISPECIES: hypothetical protein [Chitinophaga]ASZ09609.1 hypothetical protein CK934_00765 [Chitinophaga sp. MD30]UCJ07457.1 hypothetical protein KTO58_27995 [Chitinophaga pendula]
MTSADHFPNFDYNAEQLSKFLAASDFFTIMLKNGDIIHFTPKDVPAFMQWLGKNKIPNIRSEEGWIVSTKKK